MPDDTQIDPLLLRAIRGPLNRNTNTVGAGLANNPSLLRSLQQNNPQIMGSGKAPGANFTPPGAGFMPPKPPDPTVQGEVHPEELSLLPGVNRAVPGGNIDPTKADRAPVMNANDAQNILKQRLDSMRGANKDDDFKYNMALQFQKNKQGQSDELKTPAFQTPASIVPLREDTIPKSPYTQPQIYNAVKNLRAKGEMEDAQKAMSFNYKTEQFRDAIKDYNHARTDIGGWIKRNAMKGTIEDHLDDMERLNSTLMDRGHKPLNFKDYEQLKQYELQKKLKEMGPDNFYAGLKSNLTSMQDELNRLHGLIGNHQELDKLD